MANRNVPTAMPDYSPPSVDEEVDRRLEGEPFRERSRQVDERIRAHDAAGYETAMTDFSEYDDGYGNQVAHGDLSMQRMVEGGARECGSYPEPYDREPRFTPEQEQATHHGSALGAGAEARKHLHGKAKVGVVMHEFKAGTLHSGSGAIVTKPKQAVAIALSEAGLSKRKGHR